jgi:tRNA U34 5-carboxymethylaminomethyl modifying GTPase MnmE/TrmE
MIAKVLAGNKMIEESAEKCLFEVSKERLEHCPSHEPLESLRANVDRLVDDMEKEGNTLSDVKEGSVILEFSCPSLEAMLQLIDDWFEGLIQEHLKYIKESLEDIVGETIDLDVYIPREQFKNIVTNLG